MSDFTIAFDPGGTTGYASYWDGVITLGHFKTSSRLDELIRPECVVVYEKPFMSRGLDPIVFEVKGAIIERAETLGCRLIDQPAHIPSFAWKRYDVKSLKIAGSQHMKDAYCHMLYYLAHRAFIPAKDVVKIPIQCEYGPKPYGIHQYANKTAAEIRKELQLDD